MPRYSFRISRNGRSEPGSITECSGDVAAREEAVGVFADCALSRKILKSTLTGRSKLPTKPKSPFSGLPFLRNRWSKAVSRRAADGSR
jgi:hypothetical protein